MKITRVITGFVAFIALISISFSGACSVFPEKKIIYTGNRPEGFYQVTVTETEGWYNWFCAEKNTATFRARVVNKNEVDLYYEGKRHSWFEKAGKGEIRWHHKVGVGSFLGVPWRYEKRIDILPRDYPFFEMFEATTKHWQSKQSSPWLRAVLIVALVAGAGAVVVVIIVFLRRKKKEPFTAEPPPDTSLEGPIEPPPEPPLAAPPVGRARREPRIKPPAFVIAIIIAAFLVVTVFVAAFLITHYLGVNPLTRPPGEEAPAPPPTEVKPEPAVPKAKITFAILQIAGGGRDAASVRDALAGKAENISVVCEGQGSGELDVDLAISAKGNVVRAKVIRSTCKNAVLESKVAYATRGWKFGAARGTSKVKIRVKVD